MLRIPLSLSRCSVAIASPSFNQIQLSNSVQKRGRRRSTNIPIGCPPVWEKNRGEGIDEDNRQLIAQLQEIERKKAANRLNSYEQVSENSREGPLEGSSRRVGLVVRKIGMLPQWTTDGNRILCTLLEVPSNHVISLTSPEDWFAHTLVGKRKAFNRLGPMWKVTVGAGDADSFRFTRSYRAQFERANVNVKERLGSFIVSNDALPSVGTALDARHFSIGQYVTATGKSIDWGFQGGMHRWGMRGQPQRRTTKSHRRIGSVGSVSDARIWPGKRMPGHMGWEWVTMSGIQVVRMNIDEQVIYVKGNVPGDMGEWLLLKDCVQEHKRPKQVHYPTWNPSLPTIEEEVEEDSVPNTHKQLFLPNLFRFTNPSLMFTAADAKKESGRDKTKAKIAKVKK